MKRKRFLVEQIVAVLKQEELGLPAANLNALRVYVAKRKASPREIPPPQTAPGK